MDLKINGKTHRVEVEPDTPLLWVVRDVIGLKGTKFGCGIGSCGACTVHLGGIAVRSCVLPVAAVVGQEVTTIEGLSHEVQQAWVRHQVPQCGYCQSGQLMAAAALLERTPSPTDEDIDRSMTNLCRCATYDRIRAGIHAAAGVLSKSSSAAGDREVDGPGAEGTSPTAPSKGEGQ